MGIEDLKVKVPGMDKQTRSTEGKEQTVLERAR